MEIHVSLDGHRHIAGQIYEQIRSSIRSGALAADQPLPSSRELAARLSISRNTVIAAYERLAVDGLVTSRPGVGVFVRSRIAPVRPARNLPSALVPQQIWTNLRTPDNAFFAAPAPFDFHCESASRCCRAPTT